MAQEDWLGISPSSGTGNGSVTVSSGANTGAARAADVKFTGGGTIIKRVRVTQAAQMVSVTITAGTGGTLSEGTSGNYAIGTQITLSASAGQHYRFAQWQERVEGGNWTNISSSASYSYTVTGVVELQALFTRTHRNLVLSVNDSTLGKVQVGTDTPAADASVWVAIGPPADTVTYRAVPAEGSVFVKWSDDVEDIERTFTPNVSDLTLQAIFADESGLEVSPSSLSFPQAGDSETVTVTSVLSWTVEIEYIE